MSMNEILISAPVDPFAVAASEGEKGANKCAGLSGKQLKKCKV